MGKRKEPGSLWECFGPLWEKKGRVTALQIAICDDEPATLEYLDAFVNQWGKSRGEPVRAECFPSAQALWFEWEEKRCFDIFLLDIQMQGLDGVSLAHKIRKADDKSVIIFSTGKAEFAAEGYDVSALHDLLKPVDEAKLFACLDKAAAQLLLPVAGVQTRFCADEYEYRSKKETAPLNQKIFYLIRISRSFPVGKDIRLHHVSHWFQDLFREIVGKYLEKRRQLM